MDVLTSVEPQLAVPVVAVVVLAVLVYLFGFQQTQEPSFQHLAVLHSGGKSKPSSASSKQKNQSQNLSPGQKATAAKGKALSNGHVVQGKDKNKSEKVISNKENVKPHQNEQATPKAKKDKKVAETRPEEMDGDDWIPAVSRKDKKLRPKKEDASIEPVGKSKKGNNASKNESPKTVLREREVKDVTPVIAAEEEVKVIPASPATRDKKKKAPAAPSGGKKQTEKLSEVPSVHESKTDDSVKKVEKDDEIVTANIPTNVSPSKTGGKSKTTAEEPQSNVAFDEMGDLWEEAKSRGAKKKRARKD